eukprot:gb/GFBE01060806.1/.p1 GENE.gb/GFBE01060806.1/~~gb/GFBE01060806.1/.p1  ORF type:complete len:281 (+),score=63.49 gb/GFBE01060806.1/:1-843(+)
MPCVSAERLRSEIRYLLRCVDINSMTTGEFRKKLERVMCLKEFDLLDDKDLVASIVREEFASGKVELDASSAPDKIAVQVEAELEDGWRDQWHCQILAEAKSKPLRPVLTQRWSETHRGIPEAAIGFDVLIGDEWVCLDMIKTPAELGWRPGGAPVRLYAFPADDRFAASNLRAPDAKRQKKEEPTEAAAATAPPARPRVTVKRWAKTEAADATKSAGEIGDDEHIVFQQENPRKAGTQTWSRYEKYKVAKTLREALSLGAARGDLKGDLEKGLCKRQPT